ncbi:seven-hairpin glycosidase [Rhizoclosmatium globosum]|uniref:alpha-1,2-Mannosidase n=1 Tax=Rhizoclosmatium globosum TaxID=329046 RepID=A0A1Y2D1Q8_9FUNG|nr:seven-hairpin glycosidase [Rhizoclosmatium globosum]|eukprot:ORY53219.1 seven-hairpin glycosidase [Rhizoclosmatium globosum]
MARIWRVVVGVAIASFLITLYMALFNLLNEEPGTKHSKLVSVELPESVPIGHENLDLPNATFGLKLPPFIASNRESRDQPKMEFVKEVCNDATCMDGYVSHAWGHDDLNPISKTHFDWYEHVSLFETTIRVLGGLLAAYELDGDWAFIEKAIDLANRMLPAFDTPTGIPLNWIVLATGKVKPNYNAMLAELGSIQLEFQYLSDITGNPVYAEKVLFVWEQLHRIPIDVPGLYPERVQIGEFVVSSSKLSLGGTTDSYFEYLLKMWLGTGERRYFEWYYEAAESIRQKLVVIAKAGHVYIPAAQLSWPKNGGMVIEHDEKFEHLTCFAGGMFATGALASKTGNWKQQYELGKQISETCWNMYAKSDTGIGGENCDGETLDLRHTKYILRPEVVESLFYMWRYSHDQVYRDRAWAIANAINTYCRDDTGYHGLEHAGSKDSDPIDRQNDDTIPLEQYVFNTEAHVLSVRGFGKRADASKWVLYLRNIPDHWDG